MSSKISYHWLTLFTLWSALGIAVSRLDYDDLWHDEAWSLWAVRDSLVDTWQRVAADMHPPLYFIALNGWTTLTGESVYAGRMLSTVFGLLALAVTYALGKRLFDTQTGWIAVLLLGTNSFFIYYTREARAYTLLVCLAALSTWAYLRWLRRPTPFHLIIYSLTIAALPYTHYYGPLITLTHGLHLLLTHRRRLKGWLAAGWLGFLFYLPWFPIFLRQVQTNPNGPLALPVPTNWDSISWLLLVVSSGTGLWLLSPFLLGQGLLHLRRYSHTILLLVLWLLLTPLVVLTLNAWLAPLYQPRYVIAILPAVALLVAYGIRHIRWPPLTMLLLLWLVYINLNTYPQLWPPKSSWAVTAPRKAIETRQPGEPSLVKIVRPYGLEAYYDRQLGLRNANTIDLSSRSYSPAEIQMLVDSLHTSPAVWVIMPTNIGETWATMSALDTHRRPAYRASATYMLFYRFDHGESDDLQFHFGDRLVYEGQTFTNTPSLYPGEQFCMEIPLTAKTQLDDAFSYGLHLVNVTNKLVTQYDAGVGARATGEQIRLTPCLNVPANLLAGDYYLHLVVYTWVDGQRLPVFEGQNGDVFWGDALVLGTVIVE